MAYMTQHKLTNLNRHMLVESWFSVSHSAKRLSWKLLFQETSFWKVTFWDTFMNLWS